MLSLRTTIAHSASEMVRLRPLWEYLAQRQGDNIFQRFSLNYLAASLFADRMAPYVVVVESDAGATILPAAIHRSSGRLELLGETLFDYRDVLHAGDPEILRLAWQQLGALERPLQVTSIESDAAAQRWQGFQLQTHALAPGVSNLTEEEFRQAHPRLGRGFRRLMRCGVSLRVHFGGESLLVRHLYVRKGEQFPESGDSLFCDARRREFMVAAAALEGNRCEIFTLESDGGTLIAGLVTFRERDVRRFYTIYFDPAWAHYSPGVVLVYEVTAQSLAQGLSCDYMTGEYPYKLRLANNSQPLFKVELGADELGQLMAQSVTLRAA